MLPIGAITAIITTEITEHEKNAFKKNNNFQAALYKTLRIAKLDAFIKDWINDK